MGRIAIPGLPALIGTATVTIFGGVAGAPVECVSGRNGENTTVEVVSLESPHVRETIRWAFGRLATHYRLRVGSARRVWWAAMSSAVWAGVGGVPVEVMC